jgi:predicted nucleotidyltransferase
MTTRLQFQSLPSKECNFAHRKHPQTDRLAHLQPGLDCLTGTGAGWSDGGVSKMMTGGVTEISRAGNSAIISVRRTMIEFPKNRLAAFCRKHHIPKLVIFGSVLREDFSPDSDIDVLVEFEDGHVPGFAFITIRDELSKLLVGREVDLVTPKFLNYRIRERVEKEASVSYVQG